uniref:Uncharacterized protein n=1 Tax=Glossina morsitans morsitans TaxID=37546 RepID=A0ABK9NG21_GLOMM
MLEWRNIQFDGKGQMLSHNSLEQFKQDTQFGDAPIVLNKLSTPTFVNRNKQTTLPTQRENTQVQGLIKNL